MAYNAKSENNSICYFHSHGKRRSTEMKGSKKHFPCRSASQSRPTSEEARGLNFRLSTDLVRQIVFLVPERNENLGQIT